MKRRELIWRGATTLALAPLVPTAGCATLLNMFQKYLPQMFVRSMNVTGMTLNSMSTRFLIEITNPNPIGFKLDGLDYLFKLGGNQLAKGSAPRGIDLKPRTGAKTNLDLDFDLGATANAILDLLEKRIVDYELGATGKFFTKETGGIDIPVDFKGKVPVPKLPQFNVHAINPTSVSPSAVGFRIDSSVHNDNQFEIPIDGFAFDLKLNGNKVLANKGAHGLRVPSGQTSSLPVEFTLGLAALGNTASDLLQGKRMNWELGSQLKSGKLVVPFTHKGTLNIG